MREVLARPNGAKYLRADLHLHSPADSGFVCPSGTDTLSAEGRQRFARKYIDAAIGQGLSILAITDHNGVDWVEDLSSAGTDKGVIVFPGFELNTHSGADGIHLICIFEPGTTKDWLDDILTGIGLARGDRLHPDGSSKLCNQSLEDAIDYIHQKGGLVIAAHVLRDHGILQRESMLGEVRTKAWTNPSLLAAELPFARTSYTDGSFNSRAIRNDSGSQYTRERSIACVYSSDGRCLDDIGSRHTCIKLSSPTIYGLKQAFLDWESRVRHPDELPVHRFSRVIAAEWEGGFLDGLRIHFNDNLNCIIGGKGTGKSTLIETLRFAFGQTPITEDNKKAFEDIIARVFQPGSLVRVLVEHHTPHPTRYLIERSANTDPVVYRWDDEHHKRGEVLSLTPAQIFPAIRFYGQKEILESSKDRATQIALVQRFVDARQLETLTTAEAGILTQLEQNATGLAEAEENQEQIAERRRRIAALDETIAQYKELGIDKTLAGHKALIDEENLLEAADTSLASVSVALQTFESELQVDTAFLDDEVVLPLPHSGQMAEVRSTLSDVGEAIEGAIVKVRSALATALERMSVIQESWQRDFDAADEHYRRHLRELKEKGIDADEYVRSEKQRGQLLQQIPLSHDSEAELRATHDARNGLLVTLEETRRRMFRLRQAAVEFVNKELAGVLQVEIAFGGDKEAFQKRLEGLKSGAHKSQLERITAHKEFTPRRFAQALRDGPAKLSAAFGVSTAAATNLCTAISASKSYDIESWEIPDAITIALNIGAGDAPNYRDTDRLSVGQRCTAILMLILLHGEYPLVIDQPEDDLDNSFVYTDIVSRLRKEKERRQFIIATHNANIPVLGDAELIQVLEAERGKLQLELCISGSIDTESVKEPVERILEGGPEAFGMRRAKYGF